MNDDDELRPGDWPPRNCYTCEHYAINGPEGICKKHQQEPPREFASRHDACPDWFPAVIPF